jgi:hypothetical protein
LKNKLLIIGKTPPPTGGVTIHVKRVLDFLVKNNYNFIFIELSYLNLFKILIYLVRFKHVHLHTNNVYLQLILVLFSKLFKNNIILTLHGEVSQHKSLLKNWIELYSFKFAAFPIVLNNISFDKILKFNKQTIIDSAYIKPFENVELNDELNNLIGLNRIKFKGTYCTNAYDRVFDKNNKEIYGINELVKLFQNSDYFLIICDPSGSYSKALLNLSSNILIVDYPIDFNSLLSKVDGFIRNTSTDGDSISVHEALSLGIPVFCTNVVNRPQGTVLYNCATKELFDLIKNNPKVKSLNYYVYNENRIFDLYRNLLKDNLTS